MTHKFHVFVCFVALSLSAAIPATAQSFFTRITTDPFEADRANSPGAAWVDFDSDFDLDLFVVNVSNTANFLYRQDESGLFRRVLDDPIGTDVGSTGGQCWADFDNNGFLDVFVVGTGGSSRLYSNLAGEFTPLDPVSTFGDADQRGWTCTWGDIDLDGFVDLVITHPAGFAGAPSTSNHLFRNRGDGTFERVTGTPVTNGLAPYTVATFSDFDLDGDPDLFIGAGPANGSPGPDFVYRNTTSGSGAFEFERVTEGPIASGNRDGQVINWIDYDNDRDFDAYLTNWGGGGQNGLPNELFRNEGGELVKIVEGAIVTDKQVSLANLWGDFDNDGDLDVFVTDGNGGRSNRYYGNNGDGTFTRAFAGPAVTNIAVSWGASAGDYDGDGDLDLYVANIGTPTVVATINFLYRNDLDNGNHWLRLRLEGTESNRAAIGAKVHALATIGGLQVWQMREVSSQNSFNGHSSLFVHFGLGDATSVDSLVVEWPSGQVDRIATIDADQFIDLMEGGTPGVVAAESDLPVLQVPTLEVNYPNPFRDETNVGFRINKTGPVKLEVYDQLGRRLTRVFEAVLSPGRHVRRISLSGHPAGTYLYRLTVDGRTYTKVMTTVD